MIKGTKRIIKAIGINILSEMKTFFQIVIDRMTSGVSNNNIPSMVATEPLNSPRKRNKIKGPPKCSPFS